MTLPLFIFDGLKNVAPSMKFEVLGLIGMYIFSFIVEKLLKVSKKVSKEMVFAVSLTPFYGCPSDYIITNEVTESLIEDEEKRDVLTSHMFPPMLVVDSSQ